MLPNTIPTWERYLSDELPVRLTGAGLNGEQVEAIVGDIAERALEYAAGGRASRRALRVPFIDDVAGFLPEKAPAAVKADTAVVVRNSLLENAHARGPVESGDLGIITTLATGPLNAWLREHSNVDEHRPPQGRFAAAAAQVRAWAALEALSLAAEKGGRRSFRMPPGALPDRPVGAPVTRDRRSIMAVRSGIDPLDDDLLARLDEIASGDSPLGFCSSLSRYSRDSVTLSQVLEFILAHGGTVLTTNFMIRPGEVFARRPPFVGACSYDPVSVLNPDRMPGLMAKYTRAVMQSAAEQAT